MTKIVFTEHSKQRKDILFCQCCHKKLADMKNEEPDPSYKELYQGGCIPVPNFGWICSQKCAEDFEIQNDIRFQRDSKDKIDYYNGELF